MKNLRAVFISIGQALFVSALLFAGICFLAPVRSRSSFLSLPIRTTVACSAQAGCYFLTPPNTMAVVIARFSSQGTITDSRGDVWTRDQCVTFTGNCSYHTNFGSFCGVGVSCTTGVQLSFSGDQFSDVLILIYDGNWNFDAGNLGTYADQNSVFPDCTNGGDCPYAWTLPIDTEAGALILAWGESCPPNSGGVVRSGPGYTLEGKATCVFAEDMIAPTTGVYIGSWMGRNADGSESGGGHWLAGIAAYKKQ
jgi:hypothetical protein